MFDAVVARPAAKAAEDGRRPPESSKPSTTDSAKISQGRPTVSCPAEEMVPPQAKFSTFSCPNDESGVESPGTSETQSASSENGDFSSRLHSEEETSDYPRSTPSPTSYSTQNDAKPPSFTDENGGKNSMPICIFSSPAAFANYNVQNPSNNSSQAFVSLSCSRSVTSSNFSASKIHSRLSRTKSADLIQCDSLQQHATRKRRRRRTYPCLELDCDMLPVSSLQLPQSVSISTESNLSGFLSPRLFSTELAITATIPSGAKVSKESPVILPSTAAKLQIEQQQQSAISATATATSTKRNDSELEEKICKKVKLETVDSIANINDIDKKGTASQNLLRSHYKLLHSSKLNSNNLLLRPETASKLRIKSKDDLKINGAAGKDNLESKCFIKDEEDSKWRKVESELFSGQHLKEEKKMNGEVCALTKIEPDEKHKLIKGKLNTLDKMNLDFMKIKSLIGSDMDIEHEKAKRKINEILMFDHSKVKFQLQNEKDEIDAYPCYATPPGRLYICESSSQSTDSCDKDHSMSSQNNVNDDDSRATNDKETITAKSTSAKQMPPVSTPSISTSASTVSTMLTSSSTIIINSNSNSIDAFEKTDSNMTTLSSSLCNGSMTAVAGLPRPTFNGSSGTVTPEGEEVEGGDESKVVERVFMRCKWKDCGLDVEDLYLLDHLKTEHLGLPAMKVCDNNNLLQFALGLKESSTALMGSASRARGTEKPEHTVDENLTCLWEGCKVYGATSSARGWLQKHITAHVGAKPFRCILDTCRARFSTQISLSRHVNSHFKPPTTNSSPGGPRRGGGGGNTPDATTPIKFYIRKTRRKSRSRRLVRNVNAIDLFDIGVMAGVKDALSKIKRRKDYARLCNDSKGIGYENGDAKKKTIAKSGDLIFDRTGTMLVLQAKIICRKLVKDASSEPSTIDSNSGKSRKNMEGIVDREDNDSHSIEEKTMCLVQYLPSGILDNEWVASDEYKPRKRVPIIQLSPPARQIVHDHIFGRRSDQKEKRKTRPYLGPPRLT